MRKKKNAFKIKLPLLIVASFLLLGISVYTIARNRNDNDPGQTVPGITSAVSDPPVQTIAVSEGSFNTLTSLIITTLPVTTPPATTAPPVTTVKPTVAVTHTNTPTPAHTATATPSPTPTATITPTVTDYSHSRQVAPGCPATTLACVPCTSGTLCRFEAGYPGHGFQGWSCQDNNPGNIRPAAFKNAIIINNGGRPPCGQRTDADGRGDYMVFASYSDGYNGLKAYLKGIAAGQHPSYHGTFNGVEQVCGECNLKVFSALYAGTSIPAQDAADSYANRIANRLGVDVDVDTTMLSWITANKLDELAGAIQINEGFYAQ